MWCFPSSAASCGLMFASVLLCSSGSVLSALRRSSAGEFLAEDSNPCFSLRENEDQRQLLCNDRRSKFNFNPFGLRFGKRYNGYIYRRAVKTARTNRFPLLSLFSRELDEHWCFCELNFWTNLHCEMILNLTSFSLHPFSMKQIQQTLQ